MNTDHERSKEPVTSTTAAARWSRPRADVIRMDAEIGSYQDDQDPAREDRWEAPLFSQR